MDRARSEVNIEPPKERIDSSDGKLMTITALGFDSFQGLMSAIPFAGLILGPLVSFLVWLTFFIWLKLHGVTIGDSVERMAVMFAGFFFELIPLLNILPIWTLTIFITVKLVQRTDRKKIKEFYEQLNSSPRLARK